MFTRCAVYYTPEVGTPLAEFGACWLGWDSATGTVRPHPITDGVDVGTVTEMPRKYGFHGTIKPPFRLAEGQTVEALTDALADLCATAAPVTLEGLKLARLGRFLALVPSGDADGLAALAARAVTELDGFRAPPTEAELARRRGSRLSPAQDANLLKWGYPYVLDQFRFHLTLTGPLDKTTGAAVEATLTEPIAALGLVPYRMTGLTLLGEDMQGMFHQIHRYTLAG